ncbi:tRNA (adenosine(37)-N6)-threonylcarbamoyltransferase complex dimerization subunit type 1 TsaB [Pseudoluteimonas lycopersici]|uniref:tRNA threonylcarbamoyladenosine biosynthesis protein TsaB n=1 Tax=Pseudoluteimonas lycopersici TaxID=1324796 RepID=A0A516V7S4_9GAMM|nr:tRNA (adenosine(37)-N6)-threonylcarbamoyltransferase complex dimerization subunit type 1 TsaB [Lysobacter lycopersici]QDQ74577.1 tRNA (adenosine(37)-N6)-threonylcarbamoyltransferase complex dimerization subunit type 1 TsaB [Lysobacter lycopersici]
MKLLAIETATEACSVALWIDGEVRESFGIAPRQHAELALPWAERLLADAGVAKSQLDAIAVGRGPGAFTGVRLAVALAQGIALALDRPVVPVSTLAALAFPPLPAFGHPLPQGEREQRVLASIDARMGEIYVAAFRRDGDLLVATSDEIVIAPAHYELPQGDGWIGVGTGFSAADGTLQSRFVDRFVRIDATALPHAADVARIGASAFKIGGGLAPERVEPAYLRNNVALTLAEQRDRNR